MTLSRRYSLQNFCILTITVGILLWSETSLCETPAETCEKPHFFLQYHEESKHYLDKYAASKPQNWDSQPYPYRYFVGVNVTKLPFPSDQHRWSQIPFSQLQTLNEPEHETIESVSFLTFHSFALSAEKQSGDSRWNLRVNPSSGNLHPTEVYMITECSESWCIYHYDAEFHQLELRASHGPSRVDSESGYF